ncbi:MAG TPA: DUF302 domain-containing protein [Polyangia bacterium]|nr:DUF302 domain-containing protein [Polyangia bacterium]
MSPTEASGLVDRRSAHDVDATVARVTELLRAKGATLFAVVDHGGEAARVGLSMRPTKLLIFGSPSAGTPLMLAAPGIAIDLPLKILVWEDAAGTTWLTTNSPAYLRDRHGLAEPLTAALGAADAIAEAAARP